MAERYTLFASCSPGLEPFLQAEVRELGFGRVEGQPGGVQFTGVLADVYRANLWLRTASRVRLVLRRFPCRSADELYAGARGIAWEQWLRPDGTFLLSAHCRHSALDHEVFAAQRTKDAVADRFRDRTGRRPDVAKRDPDLRIHVHLVRDRCTLLLDTSGESLHKRGWRVHDGVAPLKETLAAGCLLGSGWDRRAPLIDPFCGSGTILVEGALLAGGFAPGRYRERYGFEGWTSHDPKLWSRLREEARAAGEFPSKLTIAGRDADPAAVHGALENLRAAGFGDRVKVSRGEIADFAPRPGWNGYLVTNPPWGERVGERRALPTLYRSFGRVLRERCAGYFASILCARPELLAELGIVETRGYAVASRPLECRLSVFELPR